MKKMIVLMLFIIPLSATADNIIFNPGFDMTPWDTGWVKDTSTDTSFAGSGYAEATAIIDSSSLAVSPTRSCNLKTIISCYNVAGVPGAATADAYASISQMFNPVSNCLFKALLIDSFYGVAGKKDFHDNIQLYINGKWKEVWAGGIYKNWTEICTTITSPDTVSGIGFASYETGGGGGTAGWMVYIYKSIYIDDVQIIEIGVEESSNIKNQISKIIVEPNPFVQQTAIRKSSTVNSNSGMKIKVYDIGGRLVEETNDNIIGKKLKPGIYFIRIENLESIPRTKFGIATSIIPQTERKSLLKIVKIGGGK